nr:hypothetical protein [Tanacetum cinerariifolium]
MGDFNVALNMEDYYSRSSTMSSEMIDFKDCVANIEVMDINSWGIHYTWTLKPKGCGGVLKKLDRIMGNIEFCDVFQGAYAVFQPYLISDHSPAVLKIPSLMSNKPKPFKFSNFITFKDNFLDVVSNSWNVSMDGHDMFKVVFKLKALKKPLRKFVYDHGNLHDRVNKLWIELDEVQKALDIDPAYLILKEEAAEYLHAFNEAKLDEERNQRRRVETIRNENNVEFSGPNIAEAFISHHENLEIP